MCRRQSVGDSVESSACKRIASTDGVDRFDVEAGHDLDAFRTGDVTPVAAVSDKVQLADLAEQLSTLGHILFVEKLASFVGVAKNDVAILFDKVSKIVFEQVDQKQVGKRKRRFDSQLFRLLKSCHASRAGVFACPQVTLNVAGLTIGQSIEVDVGGVQRGRDPEVGAHGPFCVGRCENNRSSRWQGGAADRCEVGIDACRLHIFLVELAVLVRGDLSCVDPGTATLGDRHHRVRGRTARR